MKNDVAISIENVTKHFVLPHQRAGTIKSLVVNPFARYEKEKQLALNDVSLEIKKGEFFGIVGRNGSGKSTLLKCIAGVYKPDGGQIKINGSLVPFIELGVGFNPNLSGRDNVFLNGALLGFSRPEIEAMYDSIVEFAELERFMDQKLKNYSSGMQVRLAFSIAIRAQGDILLLDEVLAVGDSSFQRKCLEYFREIKKTDKTIVLVTHGMSTVEEFCDRAMMLEDSKVVAVGSPMRISMKYQMANSVTTKKDETSQPKKSIAEIKKIVVRSQNKKTDEFSLNEDLIVDVELNIKEKRKIQVSAALYNTSGEYVSGISSKKDLPDFSPKTGISKLTCKIAKGQFASGPYRLNIVVATNEEAPQPIDIASTDVGAKTPIITFVENSEYKKGQFYMSAKWQQEK